MYARTLATIAVASLVASISMHNACGIITNAVTFIAHSEKDADREKRIREKLKNGRDHTKKTAWKCTCKKPVHDEKCQLFSTEYATRKWAGKNVGVTEDDLRFLTERESLAKRQKRK